MNRNILLATTAAAGIIGLTALAPAQAQTITQFTINGGGSSLAVNEYIRTVDAIAGTTNIWANESTHAGQIGQFRYNADGSGAGQKAFLIQDATVHGYTAGLPVHFGGSDAFLSADQVSCWQGVTASCTAAEAMKPICDGSKLGITKLGSPAGMSPIRGVKGTTV